MNSVDWLKKYKYKIESRMAGMIQVPATGSNNIFFNILDKCYVETLEEMVSYSEGENLELPQSPGTR